MPRGLLIEIEMHHRDELVREWMIKEILLQGGAAKISYEALASEFKCTWVTARNIIIRLRRAGHIIGEKESNTSGYEYRLPEVAA